MNCRTIQAVAFLGVCAAVVHKMCWTLEQGVLTSQEEKATARARHWNSAVAAIFVGVGKKMA